MFESFGDFFWTFMAMSGFMFWICFVGFVMLIIKRRRKNKGSIYEF
jgi:heme/copper-type cytochrome/quinol oxidase subunit 2